MDKKLKKEILKYSSAAGAFLAAPLAQAQYQYTDIADTTVSTNGGIYSLDIDQDGTPDFTLTQYVDTGSLGNTDAVIIQPVSGSNNQVNGENVTQYNYPFNLQAGTVIDAGEEWEGTGGSFDNGFLTFVVDGQNYPNSNWVGPINDGYLGLRIYKNSLPHYGWVRLDIGADSKSFTVKDFAINTVVDSSIIVGYELLGEMENMLEKVEIYQSDNKLKINKSADMQSLAIRVFSMNGALIAEEQCNELQNEMVLENMPTGAFVIELQSGQLVRREKMIWLEMK